MDLQYALYYNGQNYQGFIAAIQDIAKTIKTKLKEYSKLKDGNTNTIELERLIDNLFKEYWEKYEPLAKAYDWNNAIGMSMDLVDKRNKEIQQLKIDYDELKKEYDNYKTIKYSFKGDLNTENNAKRSEYQNLSVNELIYKEREIIADQDQQIEGIILDAKAGTQIAKEVGQIAKEQNKQLDQINEDMDMTKDNMNKLTERFQKYVSKYSTCKMIIILVIELIIALFAWIILG